MVGRISWMIDPEFRGVGLGTLMVNHLIDIARDHGLRHLSCMLISDLEADAVQTLHDARIQVVRRAGLRHRSRRQPARHDQARATASERAPARASGSTAGWRSTSRFACT